MDNQSADSRLDETRPPVHPGGAPALGRRLRVAARVVQVRLRFVIVLVVAFLVVGLWGNLRNYWDTLTHRLTGSQPGQHSVSEDTEYWCPMDPGVISDWPAICPVCNMDLVRRKKGEAVVLPEGLVARMQFSPYRIQLAGIKTSIISRQPLAREIVLAGRLVSLASAAGDRADTLPSPPPDGTAPSLVLECDAYAGDIVHLAPGRRADVSIEGLPGLAPCAGIIVAAGAESGAIRDPHIPTILIRLENPPVALRAGMYCTARIAVPLSEIEPFASSLTASTNSAAGYLAVPESAIVDTGSRRVAFVESMPGMFDGVEVTLGPRCGDVFPVLTGLEAGQKVASVGAFLIDAEARLTRNMAANYFGAARAAETGAAGGPIAEQPIEKRKSPKKPTASKLSAADQLLVKQQQTCPVTGLPLDSMGGPLAVDVAGRRVFICCQGCESKLKHDPEKYLAKLKPEK